LKESFGKPLYSPREAYRITVWALRSLPHFLRGRKKARLNKVFIERIMIAVTEVNGCEICSYAEAGMPENEIREMLLGVHENVPGDQLSAIVFGQHYADTRGWPSSGAYQKIEEVYGRDLALGILGAIRLMMWGNTFVGYEMVMLLLLVPMIPVAGVHALVSGLTGRSFDIKTE